MIYQFKVNNVVHEVEAPSAGDAMQYMNRNVMDQLGIYSFAWMDSVQPNSYYAAAGNFWD
jgi:hypothetical protein